MIKGLTTGMKPFLTRVRINHSQKTKLDQDSFVDLYIDKPEVQDPTDSNLPSSLIISVDYTIKSLISSQNLQQVADFAGKLGLVTRTFRNREEFLKFLKAKEEKKYEILKEGSPKDYVFTPFSYLNNVSTIKKYIDFYSDKKTLNVPISQTIWSPEGSEFLAFAFFLHPVSVPVNTFLESIIPGSIMSEVILQNGEAVSQSGYFTISDTFGYEGQELSLFETTTFIDVQDKDPATGFPVGATKPTDLVQQVNLFFGAPGNIWAGPLHFHEIIDKEGNLKYRPMAGQFHNSSKPLPYLDYNVKPNDKIIDMRSKTNIEKMFVYNSDMFTKLLAQSTEVLYTGGKKKNTIDDLVPNKAIVSEINYSIRPTRRPTLPFEKDNIHFLFALDKIKLLKETTKLPGLLDKLAHIDFGFVEEMVENLEIERFEIIRINKTTGENKSLIVGDNDTSFNDIDNKDYLGNDISQGYSFRNKTDTILANNKDQISFYEFTDGEIDASKYDNGEFTYKISLSFRDPLIDFFTEKLQQTRVIIKELDELADKTRMKIFDNSKNSFVDVYNIFQEKLNSQFVKDILNKTPNAQLPLTFEISKNQIPQSIETAFPLTEKISFESLSILFVSLNRYDDLEPKKNFASTDFADVVNFFSLITYIRNSLKLSQTTPSLIQEVRSLISLLEARLSDSLKLYSNENITKTETSFSAADYYKSTNVKNAGSYIIDFQHTFKKTINLTKTKNYFNWIAKSNHMGGPSGIKTISVRDYAMLVRSNYDNLLSEEGKNNISFEDFSYSFLPLMGSFLEFFNNDSEGFEDKNLQSIRKQLFGNISYDPQSVSIPESLAFFGIKFPVLSETLESIFIEQAADTIDSINFEDNIGQPFDPTSPISNKSKSEFLSAFGSIEDPAYQWQGDSFDNYPILQAKSLVNIINSNNLSKPKNIGFLRNQYKINKPEIVLPASFLLNNPKSVFGNKELPFEVNLFSHSNIASAEDFSNKYVLEKWLSSMFNNLNGENNFYNFYLYILLLTLFGKVRYFSGFEQGEKNTNLTPTSYENRNFMKSMIWQPLNKGVLDSLRPGNQIFCKVGLFESEGYEDFFDQKILKRFMKFYNYNKYFFIAGTTIAGLKKMAVKDFKKSEIKKINTYEADYENEKRKEKVKTVLMTPKQTLIKSAPLDAKTNLLPTNVVIGSDLEANNRAAKKATQESNDDQKT